MKILVFLVGMMISTSMYAQDGFLNDEIIGFWNVVNCRLNADYISNYSDADKKTLDSLSQQMTDMSFIFDMDHTFDMDVSKLNPQIAQMFLTEPFEQWVITDEDYIRIGTPEDDYSHMYFIVLYQDNKTYFQLGDTPFVFEVEK